MIDIDIYADYMKIEDFPELQQIVINEIGIKNYVKLLKVLGGINLYFPTCKGAIAHARERLVCKEFNGFNYVELAKKHKITEVWVRQIINKNRDQKK